jgi:hypothetical protein
MFRLLEAYSMLKYVHTDLAFVIGILDRYQSNSEIEQNRTLDNGKERFVLCARHKKPHANVQKI